MADLPAILASLAETMRDITGGPNVNDYYSDSLTIPVEGIMEIGPTPGDGTTNSEHARQTGDSMDFYITASLYLSTASEKNAQARMTAYMSRGNTVSVWDAFDAAVSVAGVYEKLLVLRSHSYANRERSGGGRLLTNSWDLKVTAT